MSQQKIIYKNLFTKEMIEEDKAAQEIEMVTCPICTEFMFKTTMTVCGHSFCEQCIDEYMIYKKTCFVCQQLIRGKHLTSCVQVD